MRCTACHTYIPEGLPEPVKCPQCGRSAQASSAIQSKSATSAAAAPASPAQPASDAPDTRNATDSPDAPLSTDSVLAASSPAFAPYFTIRALLAYGPAASSDELRIPAQGSISFGSEGFSLVFDNGQHWEKILYRDLDSVRPHDDSVVISVKGTENRLTIYHQWLPTWLTLPRRRRATVFLELLARVRSGLTASEIALFKRRLGG